MNEQALLPVLERIAVALEKIASAEPKARVDVQDVIRKAVSTQVAVDGAEAGLSHTELMDRCECGHVAKNHHPTGDHPCSFCDCQQFKKRIK